MWVKRPLLPVTLIVKFPVGALFVVVMVSVEIPKPWLGEMNKDAGIKDEDMPIGWPVRDDVRATEPVKPERLKTPTVAVAVLPAKTTSDCGKTFISKSGGGGGGGETFRVSETE